MWIGPWLRDGAEVLSGIVPDTSYWRTTVGKLVFLASERPEVQFCVKDHARGSE